MSEIQAVRIRTLPAEFALAGLSVWCGRGEVQVQGYKTVAVYAGVVPGEGTIHVCVLTVVQPRSQPAPDRSVLDDVRSWADEWIGQKGHPLG